MGNVGTCFFIPLLQNMIYPYCHCFLTTRERVSLPSLTKLLPCALKKICTFANLWSFWALIFLNFSKALHLLQKVFIEHLLVISLSLQALFLSFLWCYPDGTLLIFLIFPPLPSALPWEPELQPFPILIAWISIPCCYKVFLGELHFHSFHYHTFSDVS